ncbi:MAG: hypothetical protein L0H10_07520, partial [Comamonas sp.]|nr:hypothetical protein [Comamonas sp.]
MDSLAGCAIDSSPEAAQDRNIHAGHLPADPRSICARPRTIAATPCTSAGHASSERTIEVPSPARSRFV